MNEEIKQQRLKVLTGTDISAICGLNPYKSESDVWLEKKEMVEEIEDNKNMKWGRVLEPVIDEQYQLETGHITKEVGFIRLDTTIFGGIPDRICVDDAKRGVEIKTGTWRQAANYGDEDSDDIPEQYLLQCAWYMMLTDRSVWDVPVLLGGNEFKIFTVNRSAKLEKQLTQRALEWWDKHIINDEMPALSNNKITVDWLNNTFSSHGEDLLTANNKQIRDAHEYAEVKRQLKVLETKKAILENNFKAQIKDKAGIRGDNFKFTWKKVKLSPKVNWEGLAKDLNPSDELVHKYTSLPSSYRKIHFTSKFN